MAGPWEIHKLTEGTWGDDIELEAFRRAYERAIVIYDASTGTPYVKPFNGDEGTSLSAVHLWKSDCHYESVRNKDGPFDGPSRVVYKVCVLRSSCLTARM